MAKWTGKRVQVAFNKPKDPTFLADFKRRTGYKEDNVRVSEKFAELPPASLEDLADEDGDLPQVVGSSGRNSLSVAECDALQQEGKLQTLLATGSAQQDGKEGGDGKMVFKRPSSSKRPVEEDEAPTVDDSSTAANKEKEKKRKKKRKLEEEKKKKLLSFDEDEEQE